MINQISAENLHPTLHNGVKVITTELLAHLYGTERQRVTNNFNRNKPRFVEGKHYFIVKGEALEILKNSLRGFQKPIAGNVRKIILWTERGAARHAKMLETDQAWEVFEKLEDYYFAKDKEKAPLPTPASRYQAFVIIRETITGKEARLNGEADTIKAIAEGIATELGYKPVTTIIRNSDILKILSE